MNIDFDKVLTNPAGDPIPMADKDPTPTTLKIIAMGALLTSLEEDRLTPGLGYRLYTINDRIKDGGPVDLEADDVALIKARVEKLYGPWIVGKTWDALEGRDKPAPPASPGEGAHPLGEHRQFPPKPGAAGRRR